MAQCTKCREFFPPGFAKKVGETGDNLCIFCEMDMKEIKFEDGVVKKIDIVEEYKVAMKMIREKNDIIKKGKLEQLPKIILPKL